MSDPHPASDVDRDGEPRPERSDRADRRDETEAQTETETEAEAAARAEDDAEDVESEWHGWLLGVLVVAGIALFFAPRFLVPELLGSLGAFLVLVGALGWVVKWAIERSA